MAQHHPTHGPDTPEESQFQKFRPGRAAPGLGTFGGLGSAPPPKEKKQGSIFSEKISFITIITSIVIDLLLDCSNI